MMEPQSQSSSQVEVVWQMGVASFGSNNGEIVLPHAVYQSIGQAGIEELKLRLSQRLGGAPTSAIVDQVAKVIRIIRTPLAQNNATRERSSTISSTHSSTPVNVRGVSPNVFADRLRDFGKKAKVPRPPNAFILYRQHHHPLIKANRPDLHNNDISVILGKQWKNEKLNVKERYKSLADEMKHEHAKANPGYQYNPRKPIEKKRRMTSRKMERFRALETANELVQLQVPDPLALPEFDVSSQNLSTFEAVDNDTIYGSCFAESGIDDQDVSRHTNTDYQSVLQENDNLSLELPVNDKNIQHSLDLRDSLFPNDFARVYSSNGNQKVCTEVPQQLLDDQSFLNSLIDWSAVESDIDATLASVIDPDIIAMQSNNPAFVGRIEENDFLYEFRDIFPEAS